MSKNFSNASVQGYNMDMYPQLRGINSQQSEQINRSLRSLSVILAHVTFDTYMKILELYFVYKNVKTRRKLNNRPSDQIFKACK